MTDRPSLTLVSADGARVVFPLLPEALVRTRTADAAGERLEFITSLDDRIGDGPATTADTISALAELSADITALHWGKRRFLVGLADMAVTETAFNKELEPIAATIRLAFDVVADEEEAVSVTVAGTRWRQVPDLGGAGPDDQVYALRVGEDGSLHVRFGDGKRGAFRRPGRSWSGPATESEPVARDGPGFRRLLLDAARLGGRGAERRPQLLREAEEVGGPPPLGGEAAGEPDHVVGLEVDGPARGGKADERSLVSPPPGHSRGHPVPLPDHGLDRGLEVRE
jgi:hypothetical protein